MAKQRSVDRTAGAAADAQDFRAAVRDVTPLAHSPLPAGLAKSKQRARKPAAAPLVDLDETMPLIGSLPESGAGAAAGVVSGEGELSFRRAGVRTQVMRRLRRGLYPIDDGLDLHGLDQTAARSELTDFIALSRGAGCRCVRIVHGKGYRSGARGPVLKTAVNLWLRRHPDVMAFVSARAIDGGAGAMYVLLRA